jgi:hypothetical protein
VSRAETPFAQRRVDAVRSDHQVVLDLPAVAERHGNPVVVLRQRRPGDAQVKRGTAAPRRAQKDFMQARSQDAVVGGPELTHARTGHGMQQATLRVAIVIPVVGKAGFEAGGRRAQGVERAQRVAGLDDANTGLSPDGIDFNQVNGASGSSQRDGCREAADAAAHDKRAKVGRGHVKSRYTVWDRCWNAARRPG